MDARIAAAKADARRPRSSSSAITISATRSSSSPTTPATRSSSRAQVGQHPRGRVHRLLRRALHGRERRRAVRAASAGDPAGPRGRLLDGRHGRARSARDVLARAAGDGRRRRRRVDPGHLHQLVGRHQSLRRRARRHRLHLVERRGDADVGVGARRDGCCSCPISISAATPPTRWACRSIEMVVWDPNEIWGGLDAGRRCKRAQHDPLEGPLLGPHALHRARRSSSIRAQHPGVRVIVAPRSAVGRRAGRRRQRVDRVHHQHGQEQPVGIDLGRRHRDPPRQPPRAARSSPTRPSSSLDQFGCLCSTMFRVSPNHLLWILEGLVAGEVAQPDRRAGRTEALDARSRSIGCCRFSSVSTQPSVSVGNEYVNN